MDTFFSIKTILIKNCFLLKKCYKMYKFFSNPLLKQQYASSISSRVSFKYLSSCLNEFCYKKMYTFIFFNQGKIKNLV